MFVQTASGKQEPARPGLRVAGFAGAPVTKWLLVGMITSSVFFAAIDWKDVLETVAKAGETSRC